MNVSVIGMIFGLKKNAAVCNVAAGRIRIFEKDTTIRRNFALRTMITEDISDDTDRMLTGFLDPVKNRLDSQAGIL